MVIKFITVLAWIGAPLGIFTAWVALTRYTKAEKEAPSHAVVTLLFMIMGLLSTAWLVARYLI